MKNFVIALSISAVLFSCRDNENITNTNNGNTTENSGILLTKITTNKGAVNFHYNGKKITKITSDKGENLLTFTYTGDFITEIKEVNDNETTTYEYANGKVSKTTMIDIGTEQDGSIRTETVVKDYIYNGNNVTINLKRNVKYTNGVNDFSGNTSYKVSLNNGLMTSIIEDTEDTTYTYTIQYDDKNSPIKNITGIEAISLALAVDEEDVFQEVISSFKHNIKERKVEVKTKKDGRAHTYSSRWAFEYNAKGFPSKLTLTEENDQPVVYNYQYNQ